MGRRHAAFLVRLLQKTTARPGAFSEVDLEIYRECWGRPGTLRAGVNYYRANIGQLISEGRKRLRAMSQNRIDVLTVFIYGEKDHAVLPETVRDVGRYVAAPYDEVRIPHSAHWVQNEAPTEVNQALLRFLAGPA